MVLEKLYSTLDVLKSNNILWNQLKNNQIKHLNVLIWAYHGKSVLLYIFVSSKTKTNGLNPGEVLINSNL